jgi:sec-independent protein translocase protein TatB
MFNIGWSELLVIGIVALIVIGPKELPGALRTLGQWMAKVRRMASEFQNQFHEAMREAELADLKKEVDEMSAKAQSYAHFDPIAELGKDIEKAAGPLPDLNAPAASTPPPASSAESLPAPAGDVVAADTADGLAAPDLPPAAHEPAPSAAPAQAPAPAQAAEAHSAPNQDPAPHESAAPDTPKPDAGRAA